MAHELRILHLEDEPRDTELMVTALRGAALECDVVCDASKMLALIDERLTQ